MKILETQKLIGGRWEYIQGLTLPLETPAHELDDYLRATYGRQASQFRIVAIDRPAPNPTAESRALARLNAELGPMRPQPSAASAILAKLSQKA